MAHSITTLLFCSFHAFIGQILRVLITDVLYWSIKKTLIIKSSKFWQFRKMKLRFPLDGWKCLCSVRCIHKQAFVVCLKEMYFIIKLMMNVDNMSRKENKSNCQRLSAVRLMDPMESRIHHFRSYVLPSISIHLTMNSIKVPKLLWLTQFTFWNASGDSDVIEKW